MKPSARPTYPVCRTTTKAKRSSPRPKVAPRRILKEEKKKAFRTLVLVFLRGFSICAGMALILCVCGLAKELITHHEMFSIREIEVVGHERISEGHVKSVAGIRVGDNLLAVDSKMARNRLLGLPWVKQVSVMKQHPDKVKILVQERKAVAVILRGRLYEIDDEGVVLGLLDLGTPIPGPLITGAVPVNLSFGEALQEERILNALTVLNSIRKLDPQLENRLSEIHCETDGDVSLILKEGAVRVDLYDKDWDFKIPWILPVIEAERAQGRICSVDYINICGEKAFIGYREEGPTDQRAL